MPKYYDDQMRLVATDTSELLTYFNSLSGVTAYEVFNTLPCSVTSIINVSGTGLPKFMYLDTPIPKNKIYPKLLPSNSVNLDVLCNGIDASNTLPAPDCGSTIFTAFVFPAPNCGTVIFVSGNYSIVLFTPNTGSGWSLYGDIQSTVDINGVVTLNISVINSGITSHNLYSNELLGNISANGRPIGVRIMTSTYHPNIPSGSQVNILSGGDITYSGYETSLPALGSVIEIFNIQYNINS